MKRIKLSFAALSLLLVMSMMILPTLTLANPPGGEPQGTAQPAPPPPPPPPAIDPLFVLIHLIWW